jgi:CheY-like chemotaxis protein
MHAQCTTATDVSPPLRPCRILVVDDEEPIRAVVSEILDEEGYPVATATNGAEALQLVESGHPCVVLLDMRMPILDGWGFMRALHQRAEEPAVLVMTAAQNARAWAEEVGADGYVAKPFDLAEIVGAVERLCQTRRGEAQR